MLAAVVFDLDGLLIDTETVTMETWVALYQEHDVPFDPARYQAIVGMAGRSIELYEELSRRTGVSLDALRAQRMTRSFQLIDERPPLPGALDRIEEAVALGLAVGLASSSDRRWIEHHLDRLGVSHRFGAICCADDVPEGRAKPAPDLYVGALALLGVVSADAIAFEDSPHGVTAAKAAGIRCVAVPGGPTSALDFSHADHIVTSLAEVRIADFLRNI